MGTYEYWAYRPLTAAHPPTPSLEGRHSLLPLFCFFYLLTGRSATFADFMFTMFSGL